MAKSIVARDELEIGAHYVYTLCLFPILRDPDRNGYYKFLLLLYVYSHSRPSASLASRTACNPAQRDRAFYRGRAQHSAKLSFVLTE